ncbi:MAG: ABC transporter ATP-binding protein [Candidatus Eisenbacteria bacterium]|nr:ABC transporter ATP-binding protein [Candidatus Eisenbacteria bacterium]
MEGPLLAIEDLRTCFFLREGTVRAVDRLSLTVRRGEAVGLVGESGCGKSVAALSVLRLVPPPGKITGGAIRFDGQDLLALPEREMRRVRGRRISMVFQEPMTSLNPVLTCGYQVEETLRRHEGLSGREAARRAVEILGLVGITDPERRARDYPHRLSGGMRQRVLLAVALACGPALLIADEPTTALDVTIQAQILDLLDGLREKLGLAVLLITHDLAVVAELADRTAVMYAGEIVEEAPTADLFRRPLHPYTQALLGSIPRLDDEPRPLRPVEGNVPDPLRPPEGCRFHPRCPIAEPRCRLEHPDLEGRPARCLLVGEGEERR